MSLPSSRGKGIAGALEGWDRALALLLGAVLVFVLGAWLYTVFSPGAKEKYTEFYLLGGGEAGGYPQRLVLGEEARVKLGIVNREGRAVVYRIAVSMDGEGVAEVGPVRLSQDGRWEQEMTFIPRKVGDKVKVEFLLYRDNAAQVHRSLYLWVDVGTRPEMR